MCILSKSLVFGLWAIINPEKFIPINFFLLSFNHFNNGLLNSVPPDRTLIILIVIFINGLHFLIFLLFFISNNFS